MDYQQDWIIRQIEGIVRFIIRIITGKDPEPAIIDDLEQTTLNTNTLYSRLHELILLDKICDAENLLYEAMENGDGNALNAGILFYSKINELSDDELENNNFTREEIVTGLKKVCCRFSIMDSTVFDSLL